VKPFIVHSWLEYEGEHEAWNSGGRYAAQSDPNDFELQVDAIEHCAPSFEEWAYRFWIENAIAEAVESHGESALSGEQRRYLAHYRQ
jgi:hypothetical protein